jgi:hypothetical protein
MKGKEVPMTAQNHIRAAIASIKEAIAVAANETPPPIEFAAKLTRALVTLRGLVPEDYAGASRPHSRNRTEKTHEKR